MKAAGGMAWGVRDLRLDFFRGLSLFFIFIDHIPENLLSYFTFRSVAFSDAAEVFIFISGFTAALVYGRSLAQHGGLFATAQIYRRVWQLYVAHIFLFVIFTAEVSYTIFVVRNPMYADEMGVGDFLEQPHLAIIRTLFLDFQPNFLDILPLYIVLLMGFPLVLFLCAAIACCRSRFPACSTARRCCAAGRPRPIRRTMPGSSIRWPGSSCSSSARHRAIRA